MQSQVYDERRVSKTTYIPDIDVAVVIGRWQWFHKAHQKLLRTAASCSEHIIICIGSCNKAPSPKDPFSPSDREAMILEACDFLNPNEDTGNCTFVYLNDYLYEDNRWIEEVQTRVGKALDERYSVPINVGLFGHVSDHTSYYLHKFPQWEFIEVPNYENNIHATELRKCFLENKEGDLEKLATNTPAGILNWVNAKYGTDGSDQPFYRWLQNEHNFVVDYQPKIASHYEYIRHTVDSVVTCKGHVLLIKRREAPGEGLWALPGGHLDPIEDLPKAAIRELTEETCIKISPGALWNSMRGEKNFGHPGRSLLCRTITTVFHFPLNFKGLPTVSPADDAAEAKWFTFADFSRMWDNRELFEDHGDIGSYYIHSSDQPYT